MELCAEPQDVVSRLQERIAEKVGPNRFKVWFKGSTALSLADGIVNIGVPNPFVGEWIERHFSDQIREAANEVVGSPLELSFAIDPLLAKQVRKKQPDSQVDYAKNNPERIARAQKKLGTPPPMQVPKGTFGGFIVGESNRLAHSAAMSVAERPASQFNPLFIHGGCGIGKTHLLQAICNKLKELHPELCYQYLSGEDFTNQYVFAVKTGNLDTFRERYRNVDVLVIDDVHFFSNKRGTQTEFLHTFNAIDALCKQVVMASDAHPKVISNLSESLVTRFISGMVVKIDPPDYETRAEVLRRRASLMNRHVPDPVIQYIAENCRSNIRELAGALFKLVALSNVERKPITLSLAVQGLQDLIQRTSSIVRLSDIESVVAIYFGLAAVDLHTSRKSRTIALARGIAMYLARKHTDMSFPEIGRYMGNKNHSTVLLACRRIGKLMESEQPARWITGSGEQRRSARTVLAEIEEQLDHCIAGT